MGLMKIKLPKNFIIPTKIIMLKLNFLNRPFELKNNNETIMKYINTGFLILLILSKQQFYILLI